MEGSRGKQGKLLFSDWRQKKPRRTVFCVRGRLMLRAVPKLCFSSGFLLPNPGCLAEALQPASQCVCVYVCVWRVGVWNGMW